MPHLDICTYIVQYNWTVITFLSLYMIISVKYLPKIGKILHTRLRKVMVEAGVDEQATGPRSLRGSDPARGPVNANFSTSVSIFKNSLSL